MGLMKRFSDMPANEMPALLRKNKQLRIDIRLLKDIKHKDEPEPKVSKTFAYRPPSSAKPTCCECKKPLKEDEGKGQTMPLCDGCQDEYEFEKWVDNESERIDELDRYYLETEC